jgi:hypothetical protein
MQDDSLGHVGGRGRIQPGQSRLKRSLVGNREHERYTQTVACTPLQIP